VIEWAGIDEAGELAAILIQKSAGELWPRLNFGIATAAQ
jgi:hypothetical protein